MVYEDSDPLPSTQLAIWTYDNGLVLSRVRIAGESRVGEVPGVPLAPLKVLIPETEPSRDLKSQQIQLR